uniref:Uncharacterized protein n=1 Tax=Siphoviridae sp. ctg6Y13 TaxID=2826419 RepID=A0A8S5QYZ5_9CAUD|nr:MAG TPA: hypothetical protein [Siphoviridae sp. ctg6Y13]DAX58025.1 MAG TPA: hypothetical protein [Caudoviricetes sp.]
MSHYRPYTFKVYGRRCRMRGTPANIFDRHLVKTECFFILSY